MALHDWAEELNVGINVCDRNGKMLYLNEKAAATFEKEGGKALAGKNVLDCHPREARKKLAEMLRERSVNCYTIEKKGQRKLIYQTPWYRNGEYCGFVEFMIEIPFEMPHHIRE